METDSLSQRKGYPFDSTPDGGVNGTRIQSVYPWAGLQKLTGKQRCILLLPCCGNILSFRSEAVERMGGRKPTFLLPDGVHSVPA